MNSLQITGRHIEIDEPTRERIESKAEKLQRFFDRINEVDVVLAQEKFQQIAEVVLICDGVKIKAQEANEEMLTALDRVFEKVERQIKKYKRRLIDTRRRGGRKSLPARETVFAVASPVPEGEEGEIVETVGTAEKVPPHVIDVEKRDLLALSPEEAAMHLDLSGDDFFVFLNVENHHINVIYNRSDGHCGLIEAVGGDDQAVHG
jgi:putative sigma-54 modulation protein